MSSSTFNRIYVYVMQKVFFLFTHSSFFYLGVTTTKSNLLSVSYSLFSISFHFSPSLSSPVSLSVSLLSFLPLFPLLSDYFVANGWSTFRISKIWFLCLSRHRIVFSSYLTRNFNIIGYFYRINLPLFLVLPIFKDA